MTFTEAEKLLFDAGVDTPGNDVYLLAEHFLNIPKSRLVLMRNEDIADKGFISAVERRKNREPLQYIIGTWGFMDEIYEVNENVLVPRADTEILVQYGIDSIPEGGRFADLCTGSGCVAISVLAHRKDLTAAAVELYPETLKVAEKNAALNKVADRCSFVNGDVCEEIFEDCVIFDAVLANPPYVTPEEYRELSPEVHSEPFHALTDGVDGLSIIGRILDIYPKHITDTGFIAIEMGCDQGEAVAELCEKRNLSWKILKDYAGKDRVCVAEKSHDSGR